MHTNTHTYTHNLFCYSARLEGPEAGVSLVGGGGGQVWERKTLVREVRNSYTGMYNIRKYMHVYIIRIFINIYIYTINIYIQYGIILWNYTHTHTNTYINI